MTPASAIAVPGRPLGHPGTGGWTAAPSAGETCRQGDGFPSETACTCTGAGARGRPLRTSIGRCGRLAPGHRPRQAAFEAHRLRCQPFPQVCHLRPPSVPCAIGTAGGAEQVHVQVQHENRSRYGDQPVLLRRPCQFHVRGTGDVLPSTSRMVVSCTGIGSRRQRSTVDWRCASSTCSSVTRADNKR